MAAQPTAPAPSKPEDVVPQQQEEVEANPFDKKFEGFGINYECESFAVRKYRTNEVMTVKRGLDDNLQEFFETDLGYERDNSYEDLRLWIMLLSLIVGILAHVYPMPFNEARPYMIASIVAYYGLMGIVFYIATFLEGDQLFVTVKKLKTVQGPVERNSASGHWAVRLIKMHIVAIFGFIRGIFATFLPFYPFTTNEDPNIEKLPYKIRIKSEAESIFSTKCKITIQIVSPRMTLVTSPTIYYSASEEWSIGDFFDKEGYVYPPMLKKKATSLLNKAIKEGEKKLKGKKQQ